MKISGIYKIQSIIKPERCYIGSAAEINLRWRKHLEILRRNQHHSIKLQNHFNKYGEVDLQFSILLGCDKEYLIINEQFFIDSYKPYFNICPNAANRLNTKHSEETKRKISKGCKGHRVSDEAKLKLSERSKGNKFGLGHKHSDTTRKLMSQKQMGNKKSLGKTPWNKGRKLPPHSVETKKKQSTGVKKYWLNKKLQKLA